MAKVYAFFADGLEMVEGLTVVDVLRRGGVDCSIVSISDQLEVVSSHQVKINCDVLMKEIDFSKGDMIFLPGGLGGMERLDGCQPLKEEIKNYLEEGKYVTAICASPTIFGRMGILEGKKATCYPGMEGDLKGAKVSKHDVVVDGTIVTGRAMGPAILFALKLLELLTDKKMADQVAKGICFK